MSHQYAPVYIQLCADLFRSWAQAWSRGDLQSMQTWLFIIAAFSVKKDQTDKIMSEFLSQKAKRLDPLFAKRGYEPLNPLLKAESQVLLELLVTAGSKMFACFLDAGLFTQDRIAQGSD